MENNTVKWEALEFEEKEKGVDWFWAVGIIAVCAIVVSIIYKNYLFAIFTGLASATMMMFANQKPKMMTYELSSRGLRINDKLLPIDSLLGYAIREIRKSKQEILVLETSKPVNPIMTIPIHPETINDMRRVFADGKVPEKDLHEPTAHQIMDAIGF